MMISALDKLLQKSSVELQQCIAETSSCAILTFLLRILSNPKLLPKGAGLSYLSKLLEKVMFVSPAITADTEYVRSGESRVQDLFYAMAGDKMGSYFLETLFEACPVHVFDNLMTEYAFHLSPEAVLDYAKDAHGNFLLQAVLKRLVTQSSHYSNLLQVAHTIACSLLGVAKGDFADLCRSRIMVVYWLSELIRTMHADDMMLALFDKVFEVWTDVKNEEIVGSGVEVAAQYLSSQLVQKEKKVEGKSDDDLKPMDSFSVNLAKIIGSFLQSSETTVRGKIRCTVCLLSTDALRHVGTTGALSKAIFDVFLDSSSEAESKQLGQKLVSIAYDLAAHYAGQHVLRRVYQSSDLRGREKWVSTLLTRKEDLVKSKEGRNALHAMSADLFERDTNSWRAEVKKLMKEQQKEQEAKKRERELEVGEKGGDDEGGEGRRKRKRKRGGKKKTDGSGGEVDNDNEEED
ncbi:hypothetical protein EON65_28385 [archaeon]|nr:MAG: hypothetical protein EON65_28385 [archaeon]